jgi:hypothetical protein
VAIHHPNCDEKAISFNHDPITVTSYLGESTPGDGTHWRIDEWEDGTTEPGSSGSGIWDPNHRLVGQLHGGYASCTSITSDWYGRLSKSWNGGASDNTRLRTWLDPQGTGVLVKDGVDPQASSVEEGTPSGRDALRAVRPNPAFGVLELVFDLSSAARVGAEIYDASGRLVIRTAPGGRPAGPGSLRLEARAGDGSPLPAGLYFVRLDVEGRLEAARKLLVLD